MVVMDIVAIESNVLFNYVGHLARDSHRPLAVAFVLQPGIRIRAVFELQVILVELGVALIERADATDPSARVPGNL